MCFRQVMRKHTPVYQALWANNTDFDEVLISPVMIQDHMPDQVLAALEKASLYSFTACVVSSKVKKTRKIFFLHSRGAVHFACKRHQVLFIENFQKKKIWFVVEKHV